MKILVTGSLGLIGSEAVRFYLNDAWEVIGVDNDMRRHFFGDDASVQKNMIDHRNYRHHGIDISKIESLIELERPDVVIHAAAQPSHDWSATNPLVGIGTITPTASPSATPTVTLTPTITSTPTATSTAGSVFLPVLER